MTRLFFPSSECEHKISVDAGSDRLESLTNQGQVANQRSWRPKLFVCAPSGAGGAMGRRSHAKNRRRHVDFNPCNPVGTQCVRSSWPCTSCGGQRSETRQARRVELIAPDDVKRSRRVRGLVETKRGSRKTHGREVNPTLISSVLKTARGVVCMSRRTTTLSGPKNGEGSRG